MRDKNGVTKRNQCKIFWAAFLIMTIAMIIAATVEVYAECSTLAATEQCYSPYVCLDSGACSCTSANFTEQYALGQIKHARPYRCDPTDMDAPPLAIGNLVAFSVGILAIFAIGILSICQSRKCNCDSKCTDKCNCSSEADCTCPHDCPTCCIPSKYGLQTICTCADCHMIAKGYSEYECQCCEKGKPCSCGSSKSNCMFKQQVWMLKKGQ